MSKILKSELILNLDSYTLFYCLVLFIGLFLFRSTGDRISVKKRGKLIVS